MRGNAVDRRLKEFIATFPAQALPWSGSTGLISAGHGLTKIISSSPEEAPRETEWPQNLSEARTKLRQNILKRL